MSFQVHETNGDTGGVHSCHLACCVMSSYRRNTVKSGHAKTFNAQHEYRATFTAHIINLHYVSIFKLLTAFICFSFYCFLLLLQKTHNYTFKN
jgi:hypothetical protein